MTGSKEQFYCTFSIREFSLAIPLEEIGEVAHLDLYNPVPLAPPEIMGLVNLRSRITTLIDLPYLLLGQKKEIDGSFTCIVMKRNFELSSFLVDDLGEVMPLKPEILQKPLPFLRDQAREFIPEIHQEKGFMVLILNSQKILDWTQSPSKAGKAQKSLE